MTIKRGKPWGGPAVLAPDAPVAHDDAELAALVAERLPNGGAVTNPPDGGSLVPDGSGSLGSGPLMQIGLLGGDLHRTVGSPGRDEEKLRQGDGMGLPIDVGVIEFCSDDGPVTRIFVAHLVATADRNGRLWKGRTVLAMNASFMGIENLAPRAHPNDGRLDVIDGELGLIDRHRARRRTYAGTHVPHPDLIESRVRRTEIDNSKPLYLVADGHLIGSVDSFRLRCIADALTIIV